MLYHKAEIATMNDRDCKDSNLQPLIWGTGRSQIDTSSIRAESLFAGTTPPRVTDGNSPESSEDSRHASASPSKKWADMSDVAKDSPMNRNDLDLSLFDDEEGLYLHPDDASDWMNLSSSPPLSSLKNGEETSTGDSPLENEGEGQRQPSCDSPDTNSTGSASSIDIDIDMLWQTRFEELQDYKELHGHFDVPQRYGPLGVWVNKQRNECRHFEKGIKSQLTQQRISQLESIGFRWAKKYGQELWEARFKELKEFKEKNHHCNVHTKEGRLGRWVTSQRSDYKKNKISEGNKSKLDSIGFSWARTGHK